MIEDYCKPFFLEPNNKDLVSFDSKSYSKAAKRFIEWQEKKILSLEKEIKNLKTVFTPKYSKSKLT